VRRALAAADLTGLVGSFLVAQWLFAPESAAPDAIPQDQETLLFFATLPGWLVMAKLHGLYDRDEERTDHSSVDDLSGIFQMVTAGAWLFFIAAWLTGTATPEVGKLVFFWLGAIALLSLLRVVARALCRRHPAYSQITVVVGSRGIGASIARKIRKHPEYGLNFVGFIDEDQSGEDKDSVPLLGPPDQLHALIKEHAVERVIFAHSNRMDAHTVGLIRELRYFNVQIDVVPRFHELVAPGTGIHSVEGIPLLGLAPAGLSRSSALLKRTADIVVAGTALVLLSPLFAVVAVAIKLDSRGPVTFRQIRAGRDGEFAMLKFRTMSVDAEERKEGLRHLNLHEDGKLFKLHNDPRVTRIGKLLRRTSLDELPQLWNVLGGEMSLVGPRPLILEEATQVSSWGTTRLDLRPGMTGLWQVLGRDGIGFDEMLKLDYLYVTTWTLGRDVRLILRTLPLLLSHSRLGVER